jgi:predicted NUDIX family NTP pyrophosphohydrolase
LIINWPEKWKSFLCPGGHFWVNKDKGVWTIPKGEYESDKSWLVTARGVNFKKRWAFTRVKNFSNWRSIKQKRGKFVDAWAFEGDCDPVQLMGNTCEIERPLRCGCCL